LSSCVGKGLVVSHKQDESVDILTAKSRLHR